MTRLPVRPPLLLLAWLWCLWWLGGADAARAQAAPSSAPARNAGVTDRAGPAASPPAGDAAAASRPPSPSGTTSATERARSHLRAGVAYYDEGRYEDAAREMESAFRLRPLPDLQYNLAQCYERLGRTRDAVAAYRAYLDGKPDADDRTEVAARARNLEARAEREAAGSPAPPEPPPVREKIVFKEVVVYREAPPRPGRGLRAAAWALGGLAVVALGTGITFSVLARQAGDSVSRGGSASAPVPFDGGPAQTQAAGHQDDILGYVGYGVAGVAALGAIGLWSLGRRVDAEAASAQQASVTVAPLVGPEGAGLLVGGRF